MKKIAIVTLTKNPNYGNVLQNIALQYILKAYGCETETIINYAGSSLFYKGVHLKKKIKTLLNYKRLFLGEVRRVRFLKCCKKHIKYSAAYYDGKKICGDISSYDIFIAGSDQIWNTNFGLATSYELLEFAPVGKRYSYAASFGLSNINSASSIHKEKISQALDKFESISVREDDGKVIVDSLSKNNAYVHLDPTMLIKREEWDALVKPPRHCPDKPYILLYMLGNISEHRMEQIKILAQKYNAVIINILDNRFKTLDPLEFVWMVKNSEFIVTDSFHATVFSIIYRKRFAVMDRDDSFENQNSRFVTLFRMAGIEGNICAENMDIAECEIEWDIVDKNLCKRRNEAIKYLETILKKE